MKKLGVVVLGMFAAAVLFIRPVSAEGQKAAYIGVKKCIMCHKSRDNSVDTWQKMKHSGAYEVLASADAKKLSKDAQNDPKCLECHVTGLGQPGGFTTKLTGDDKDSVKGVTCESCHGPGELYKKSMTKALPKGSKFDKEEAKKAGLVHPDKNVCVKCHNKRSPFYKDFKFDDFWKKIKHGEKK